MVELRQPKSSYVRQGPMWPKENCRYEPNTHFCLVFWQLTTFKLSQSKPGAFTAPFEIAHLALLMIYPWQSTECKCLTQGGE